MKPLWCDIRNTLTKYRSSIPGVKYETQWQSTDCQSQQSLYISDSSEVDHAPPPSAEVSNEWNIAPSLSIFLYGVPTSNFTFSLQRYSFHRNTCTCVCVCVPGYKHVPSFRTPAFGKYEVVTLSHLKIAVTHNSVTLTTAITNSLLYHSALI